jgi:hypothetical protein
LLAVSFRAFSAAARSTASPPPTVLSWNWLPVQSSSPTEYRPHWLGRSRCAVGRFPGCAVFLKSASRSTFEDRITLSSGFTFLQSFPQQNLASRRSVPAALVDFRSLQHMQASKVVSRRMCRSAAVRLQGLATLLTVSSLRCRAGFVSHRQRSWDSPYGAFSTRAALAAFPPKDDPHTVTPASNSRRRSGGPARRAAVSRSSAARASLTSGA